MSVRRRGLAAGAITASGSFPKGGPMSKAKTLDVRQKELQSLLATPAGRTELEQLADRYATASGQTRPHRTSLITFILVHERGAGLIQG